MYVLMGANGNVSGKAAQRLVARGEKIRVIGRDPKHLEPLRQAGAETAVGSALDTGFLTGAFRGADAVYVMIPPNYQHPKQREYQRAVGTAVAEAIRASGVRHVVHLSSIGASLPEGTGPIAGLHEQEERLNALGSAAILHLRPAYFMENHLQAIGAIQASGIYPGMIAPEVPFPMIATQDIAAVVAEALVSRNFKGHSVRHLLGPRSVTMSEAAHVLGDAIGKPDLRYVQVDPAQAKPALMQAGLSADLADQFAEMSRALSDGRIAVTFARDAQSTTPTTIESFAPIFARAYRAGGGH